MNWVYQSKYLMFDWNFPKSIWDIFQVDTITYSKAVMIEKVWIGKTEKYIQMLYI